MAKSSSKIEEVFRFFDKDKDGKISASELQLCMARVGGELSAEDADELVESVDSDGDGLLELGELEKLMEAEEEEKSGDLRAAFEMYEIEGTALAEKAWAEMAIFGIFSTSRSFFTTNPFRRLVSFGGDDPPQTTGRMFSASFLSSNALLRRLWSFGNSSDEQNQTIAGSNHPSAPDVENPIPRAMEMETPGSPTAADPE